VEPEVAMAFLGVALGAIPSILRQWRQRPTEKHAELLADCYVAMVMGGLEELARHRGR
jgi:hypothetical protein